VVFPVAVRQMVAHVTHKMFVMVKETAQTSLNRKILYVVLRRMIVTSLKLVLAKVRVVRPTLSRQKIPNARVFSMKALALTMINVMERVIVSTSSSRKHSYAVLP
jgi:hypothetical protein